MHPAIEAAPGKSDSPSDFVVNRGASDPEQSASIRRMKQGRRSPGATTAPEGEDHVKVQASLGCKRNIIRPLVQNGLETLEQP